MFYYAAEHLKTYLALSRLFVISPRLLYASVSREKGEGAKEVGLSRFADLLGFYMRQLLRDIGVFRRCGTRGRIQGRVLAVATGICNCGALFYQVHICDLLPCLRNRTQF